LSQAALGDGQLDAAQIEDLKRRLWLRDELSSARLRTIKNVLRTIPILALGVAAGLFFVSKPLVELDANVTTKAVRMTLAAATPPTTTTLLEDTPVRSLIIDSRADALQSNLEFVPGRPVRHFAFSAIGSNSQITLGRIVCESGTEIQIESLPGTHHYSLRTSENSGDVLVTLVGTVNVSQADETRSITTSPSITVHYSSPITIEYVSLEDTSSDAPITASGLDFVQISSINESKSTRSAIVGGTLRDVSQADSSYELRPWESLVLKYDQGQTAEIQSLEFSKSAMRLEFHTAANDARIGFGTSTRSLRQRYLVALLNDRDLGAVSASIAAILAALVAAGRWLYA
jgi:hypothetical protein